MIDQLVTDDVVSRHCASGTPVQARAMLADYATAGLDEIVAYGMQRREHVEAVLAMIRPHAASSSLVAPAGTQR